MNRRLASVVTSVVSTIATTFAGTAESHVPRHQEQHDVEPRTHAADERVAAELDERRVQSAGRGAGSPTAGNRQRDRRAHHVHHALSVPSEL